jgi:hypothetical protein
VSAVLALVHPSEGGAEPTRVVTVLPAPRREPPFDDELSQPWLHIVRGRDRELPFPEPTPGLCAIAPTRRADLPDPASWVRRLLLGLSEAAAGRRPLNQVAALLSPSVARGLGADFERATAKGSRHWLHEANVRNIRATEPSEGVAELAATVQAGARIRAMALRLEARHGHWRCVRLQIG